MKSAFENTITKNDFIIDLMQELNKNTDIDLLDFIKSRLKNNEKEPIESLTNFRHRMMHFKQYLISDIIPSLKNDELALVVGHAKTGRYLMRPSADGYTFKPQN